MTPTERRIIAAVRARYALFVADKYSWDAAVRKATDELIAACAADAAARKRRRK